MKFVEDSKFNEMIEVFKKLPLKNKKEIDKDDYVLYNKEILDVEKEEQTEDDFVEAIYVYLSSVKEMMGAILLEHLERED